ncbi:MAG: hypothetical protein H3C35_03730 [Bacteroidetes bacterium]|nr:hypothetical protein [Bacteroidota bacterium]
MNVTLLLENYEEIDLMNPPRLDSESDIVLAQSRERDEFKRSVEDVKLVISDMDNSVNSIFKKYSINAVWDAIVSDSERQLYVGRVIRPVTVEVTDEKISIQTYSKNKDFWEAAKKTLVRPVSQFIKQSENIFGIYTTVETLISWNCDRLKNNIGFSGYAINELYKNRKIRCIDDSTDPSIGNDGRYSDLVAKTTVFDLLTAMCKYYNAEMFIDPETNLFTMNKRNTIITSRQWNLDELLLDDERIEISDTDEKKYDYIHSYFALAKPVTAVAAQVAESGKSGIKAGIYYYHWSYVVKNGDIEIESEASVSSAPITIIDSSQLGKTYAITATIPLGPSGTVKRNLYRYVSPNNYRLVTSIEDNTTTQYIDLKASSEIENNQRANFTPVNGDIYFAYDEETGKWTRSILPSGGQEIDGTVFDIDPQLDFRNSDGSVREKNLSDTFAFFGREIDLTTFAKQWIDMFITKPKVKCAVRGLPYRLGDEFVSYRHPRIPAGKYVVKKADNHLMRERTNLELIKVIEQ